MPPRFQIVERFRKSGKRNLILLILSDFDPDGEEISASFARSLRDDFGITQVEPVRVALTAEQVERFNVPPGMLAKDTSENFAKFEAKHGRHAYELEALRPEDLQIVLREAIESVLDPDALAHEIEQEKQDAAELAALRRRVIRMLGPLAGGGA